jgi:hypothetical protein
MRISASSRAMHVAGGISRPSLALPARAADAAGMVRVSPACCRPGGGYEHA